MHRTQDGECIKILNESYNTVRLVLNDKIYLTYKENEIKRFKGLYQLIYDQRPTASNGVLAWVNRLQALKTNRREG